MQQVVCRQRGVIDWQQVCLSIAFIEDCYACSPRTVATLLCSAFSSHITAFDGTFTTSAQVDSDVTVLASTVPLKPGTPAAAGAPADGEMPVATPPPSSTRGHAAQLLLRRRSTQRKPLEIRMAVIGNVDSGKSTMVGVLTRAMLDDGRGAARAKVFKHSHEGASGRTSAIGQHNLCLSSAGGVLNDSMFKNSTCSEYVSRSAKVVTLVDLAGHERYFKTTAYGLTGHLPDYACLLVGANAGVVGMCKEHLGVAHALKVPCFFVITKVDICPEHILKQSLAQLSALLKRPGVRKRPFLVNTVEVRTCLRVCRTCMRRIALSATVRQFAPAAAQCKVEPRLHGHDV